MMDALQKTMKAWSFSGLSQYVNCPRQYQLQRIKNVIPYQETEATLHGTRVHEALELYVRDGKPLPDDCLPYQKFADKIVSLGGEVFVEKEFALTKNLGPCAFADPGAWCRGIIDIGATSGNRALVADYKTGKVRHDSDQLMLFAAFVMHHHPEVQQVRTAYVWLKFDQITAESYTRDDLPRIWDHFNTKVTKLEMSYEKDKWVPKPSGLCRGWCGAGREHCEFWTPRR